jgi:hypothetical protein
VKAIIIQTLPLLQNLKELYLVCAEDNAKASSPASKWETTVLLSKANNKNTSLASQSESDILAGEGNNSEASLDSKNDQSKAIKSKALLGEEDNNKTYFASKSDISTKEVKDDQYLRSALFDLNIRGKKLRSYQFDS